MMMMKRRIRIIRMKLFDLRFQDWHHGAADRTGQDRTELSEMDERKVNWFGEMR